MQHEPVSNLARGKWRGILLAIGLPDTALTGNHVPCPMCGGKDRFRWDNKEGKGTYICGQCGAGDGIDLVRGFKGCEFREAAQAVEGILGKSSLPNDKIKPAMSDDDIREAKRRLWRQCVPMSEGDLVWQYLTSRNIGGDCYDDLLYLDKGRVTPTLFLPAMVAIVRDEKNKPVSLHRTWLDGPKKADIDRPRMLMPGKLPDGACVRLSGPRSAICVAEGIETALAVERMTDTPCWALLSAPMMAKWIAPEGVEEVTIFSDADEGFAGQCAAYALARRLKQKGVEVNVRLPDRAGVDWNDILMEKAA